MKAIFYIVPNIALIGKLYKILNISLTIFHPAVCVLCQENCDATKFCCCRKYGGKICIKYSGNGSALYGNCEKDGNALYECQTAFYPARFLKICGGVKGCESIKPGRIGADFCEDKSNI